MFRKTWTFGNGIRVYRRDLNPDQLRRYQENKRVGRNFHEPVEEEHFTRLIDAATGTGIFLDAGAALGYYSILARQIRPEIEAHALNPDPHFVERMTATLELNNISGVTIHSFAVSDRPGRGRLPRGSYGARIERSADGELEITTLDEVISRLARPVAILKLDVQGEELNALRGGLRSLPAIENIILGTHGTREHERCSAFLRENGYRVELDEVTVPNQPDGLIVARRLSPES